GVPRDRALQRGNIALERGNIALQAGHVALQAGDVTLQGADIVGQLPDRLQVQVADRGLYLVDPASEPDVFRAQVRGDGQLPRPEASVDPHFHRRRVGVRAVEGKHAVFVGLHDAVGDWGAVQRGQIRQLLTVVPVVPDGDVVVVADQLDDVHVFVDVDRGPH